MVVKLAIQRGKTNRLKQFALAPLSLWIMDAFSKLAGIQARLPAAVRQRNPCFPFPPPSPSPERNRAKSRLERIEPYKDTEVIIRANVDQC